MTNTRRQAALFVAVVMVLAGCLGGAGDTATEADDSMTPTPAEATGSIRGLVLDDEERPIAEATVGVARFDGQGNRSASTGADGTFEVDALPVGKYRVTAEALFFKRATKDVDVLPGVAAEASFTLSDLVRSSLFVDIHHLNGFINCSVHSLGAYGPFNFCQALADDKSRFDLPLRDDLVNKGVVLEVVWTPSTQATGTDLEIALCNSKDEVEDPVNCRETTGPGYREGTRGKSPLVLRARDLPLTEYPTMEVIVGDGGQTSLRVPLTFQQSFELWMSLCYAEYCPETYSARPPPE